MRWVTCRGRHLWCQWFYSLSRSRRFRSAGLAYREETVPNEADERTVIADLIAGQYETPVQIIAFNIAEGSARDVSEDVAQAMIEHARKRKTWLTKKTREFIERSRAATPLPF